MEPANTLRHTERSWKHGGLLYPLLLIAAIAVILLSIIGIATTTGLMSSGSPRDSATTTRSGAEEKSKPTRIEAPRPQPAPKGNPRSVISDPGCRECGMVV